MNQGQPPNWSFFFFKGLTVWIFLHSFRKQEKHLDFQSGSSYVFPVGVTRLILHGSLGGIIPHCCTSVIVPLDGCIAQRMTLFPLRYQKIFPVFMWSQHRDEISICSITGPQKMQAIQKLSRSYWNTNKIIPIFSEVLKSVRKPHKITYVQNYAPSTMENRHSLPVKDDSSFSETLLPFLKSCYGAQDAWTEQRCWATYDLKSARINVPSANL